MKLRMAHLYPRLMNVYGDRGNIIAFVRRCRERGIEAEVTELGPGDVLDPTAADLIFIGGAQDRDQRHVVADLRSLKGGALRDAVERGTVVLAVCGGYQLLGAFYRESSGAELPGLGIFDLWTEHPGPAAERLIGNAVVEWERGTIVGFENHGGRTHLGPGAEPLGRVRRGFGNNGKDGTEGARYRNAFGSYLHGSLLPKNPRFADYLIALALKQPELAPIDDAVEEAAHAAALRLAGLR